MKMRLTLEHLKSDPEIILKKITSYINDYVAGAGAEGVVIGISGGVDSALTTRLCVDALGKDAVLGFILPERNSNPNDKKDALDLINQLGIEYEEIDITPMIKGFDNMCKHFSVENKIAAGNLRPRIRMQVLYYHANLMNRLVVGTGNKTEIFVGYFTKYGDGGVDFEPIGDLYKAQVWELARYLKLPKKIIEKAPSAGLWTGQTDEGELGMQYLTIDLILYGYLELKMNQKDIAKELNLRLDEVQRILELVKKNEHKRNMPPIFKLSQ
ncbi:MAG: NAD+ synthase [Candidatus Helarchaeota archaeon]